MELLESNYILTKLHFCFQWSAKIEVRILKQGLKLTFEMLFLYFILIYVFEMKYINEINVFIQN
jgi:hypothetical protein